MPAPKFVTCQICGRGFGSASIDIHVPQCYDKALKRWQLNPIGPKPVMPQTRDTGGQTKGKKSASAGGTALDNVPVGAGGAAVRSLRANNVDASMTEGLSGNVNLHPCRKCGRKFNYDRIAYHESVCKADVKRPVFDITKHRMPEEAIGGGGGGRASFGVGSKRKGKGSAATAPSAAPVPRYPRKPPSTWRQQHEEFIEAVRQARRSDAESKMMWGNPSSSSPIVMADTRQPGGAGRRAGASAPKAGRPAPRRVPPAMVKVDQSRKTNMATGGRAARAQASSISTPAPAVPGARRTVPAKSTAQTRALGGGGDRFGGYGAGGAAGAAGGGNRRIVNDNTTSIGMKQAFGQA